MKKVDSSSDELRPEYRRSDFKRLVRGKYLARVQQASNVVVLDPKVATLFPNSEAVNRALRSLAEIIEETAGLPTTPSRRPLRRRS